AVVAVACLLVVNVTPQRRKQVLAALAVLVVAALAAWGWGTVRGVMHQPAATRDTLQWLDDQFAFARGRLVPSHWMTRGLQAAARGDLAGTAYPLALLWSNGLMLYLAAALTAKALYRRGYNRLATGGALRKRYGGGRLDRAAA